MSHPTQNEAWGAIYVRISQDREGREYGVTRQEDDCRALAKSHGLRVYRVYRENDVSASTRSTRPRPEYDAMLRDARAGRFAAILAPTSSRLTRRPRELEGQIELAEQCGITYAHVKSPSFDLNTASGRMVARILAAQDAAESETIGERVARARQQRQEAGGFGGGRRPYGFGVPTGELDPKTGKPVLDYAAVVESEAGVIRDVTDRVIDGQSIKGIVRDLVARGIPSATGKKWRADTLRAILIRPRNAGLAVYQGEIVGQGGWSAIVDEETWRTCLALLTDSKRVHRPKGGPAVTYLGSGIYRCLCGRPLYGRRRGGRVLYVCKETGGGVGGGLHVGRDQRHLDGHVTAVTIERLSRPDIADLIRPADSTVDTKGLRMELNAQRVKLTGLAEDYAADHITRAQMLTATERTRGRIAELESTLTETVSVSPLAPFASPSADAAQLWERMTLGDKRVVLRTLFEIDVLPAGRGRGFSPDHVRIGPACKT